MTKIIQSTLYIRAIACLLLSWSCGDAAWANIHRLPPSLAAETLSETVPTAFGQVSWSAADFEIRWVGETLPGVDVRLGEKSFEWVRVSDVLVLPRAVLVVDATQTQKGTARQAGFTQSFEIRSGEPAHLELPIALISGPQNQVELSLVRDGRTLSGRLEVALKPRSPRPDAQAFRDPSCSPYRVQVESTGGRANEWIYVGCRLVYQEGTRHRIASLEMFVFWDGVGPTIEIDGIQTEANSSPAWALRLRQRPGYVDLKAGEHRVRIKYSVTDRLHLVNFAAGIGPYAYTFDAPSRTTHSVVPLATIYGSYFITEQMRVVAFDAFPIARRSYTDFGIYLNSEYFRTLDLRLIMNLMLGAHVLVFRSETGLTHKIGAPQGFELIYRDTFMKGYNLSAGAFIYPPISGKAYYNVWVRYGTRGYFGEFNYLAWQEKVGAMNYYTRSMGVSVGFPLARFF